MLAPLGGAGKLASPSGLIALVSGSGRHVDVVVVNSDGTHLRPLTATPAEEHCPSWAPNGKMVALTVVKGGQAFAVVLSDTGKLIWQLPGISCFGWSPNGRQLLVARQRGRYVVDADGRNLRKLNLPAGSWPVWSPDGSALAYVLPYSDSSPESKRLTIVVVNL
jgi:Tol biopolymer transport system component